MMMLLPLSRKMVGLRWPTHCEGFNMTVLDEFAVDLSLSDVDRIERYIYSDVGIQRFDWFDLLNSSVVHVGLIKSLVEKKEIDIIRDRIFPLFDVIAQDKEDEVIIEFLTVVTCIVKLFSETDMDETCSICVDLVPLLMSIATSHSDSVSLLRKTNK